MTKNQENKKNKEARRRDKLDAKLYDSLPEETKQSIQKISESMPNIVQQVISGYRVPPELLDSVSKSIVPLTPSLKFEGIQPIFPKASPIFNPVIPEVDLSEIEFAPRVQNIINVNGNNNTTSGVFGDNNVISLSVSDSFQKNLNEIKNLLGEITSQPFDDPLYVTANALKMELDSTHLDSNNQSYVLQRLRIFGENVTASMVASSLYPPIAASFTNLVSIIGSISL